MARNANTAAVETTTEAQVATEAPKKDITKVTVPSEATSKSAKMRFYAAEGFKTGEIAKHMGVKYQFVRNVLVQAAAKNNTGETKDS